MFVLRLDEKVLLPDQHLVDAGYPDGENILDIQDNYQVDMFGPMRPDNGWQAREANGYIATQFHIDWNTPRATCQVFRVTEAKQGLTLATGPSSVSSSARLTVLLLRQN